MMAANTLWFVTALLFTVQKAYGGNQWSSNLNCEDKVYARSPATVQFYEDCFLERESQECIQVCVLKKQAIIGRDGTFHYDTMKEFIQREFGHHSTKIAKEIDRCVDEYLPQPLITTNSKCSNFASTWACIKDAYQEVCKFSTENLISSSTNPSLIRCQNTLAPSDREYNRIWYECKKDNGEWTECQKVCQWQKMGILLPDGSWNQSQVEYWNKKVHRYHAEPHNKAYMECHQKNGNLIIDTNDTTCAAARVHRNCENLASHEICGYEAPSGSFEFQPPAKEFQCNGRTYTRSPESTKACQHCSVHRDQACRTVCRLKTQGIIRDDYTFDREKHIQVLKKEYGQDADAIIQATIACVDKLNPYKGSPRCTNFQSFCTCIDNAHSTVCNSAGEDTTHLYENSTQRCHDKTIFKSDDFILPARACYSAATNADGRIACAWKKVGVIREDDSVDVARFEGAFKVDFQEHAFGLTHGIAKCAEEYDPRNQTESSCKFGRFIQCTKRVYLDNCGYITNDWMSTVE